jgi:hypothetical protein
MSPKIEIVIEQGTKWSGRPGSSCKSNPTERRFTRQSGGQCVMVMEGTLSF